MTVAVVKLDIQHMFVLHFQNMVNMTWEYVQKDDTARLKTRQQSIEKR